MNFKSETLRPVGRDEVGNLFKNEMRETSRSFNEVDRTENR
jgi:hypothetical protein